MRAITIPRDTIVNRYISTNGQELVSGTASNGVKPNIKLIIKKVIISATDSDVLETHLTNLELTKNSDNKEISRIKDAAYILAGYFSR